MAEQGPLSGQVLGGKYQLEDLLGEGGFGAVYSARHLLLNRPQAIKVLLERHVKKPKFRERFLREAQTLATLDHPNIVHIHDFVIEEQEERAYLVMPFVSGGTFRDILRQDQQSFTPNQVIRYLEQICAALDYAHQRNVVHLDLKPQNLLVHPDGRLLLSDFGLAHLIIQETIEGGSSLLYGTPLYKAPEHWKGEPEKRSDIYALGVIFYEILTGQRPFKGTTLESIMMQHLMDSPAPLRSLRPDLPEELEEIIQRVLAKAASHRYTSASELLVAFQEALNRQQQRRRYEEEERQRKAREQEEQFRRTRLEEAHKQELERVCEKAEERMGLLLERQRRQFEEERSREKQEWERERKAREQGEQLRRAQLEEAYRQELGRARKEAEEQTRLHKEEERQRKGAEEQARLRQEDMERLVKAWEDMEHLVKIWRENEQTRQDKLEEARRIENQRQQRQPSEALPKYTKELEIKQGDGSDILGPGNPQNSDIGIIYVGPMTSRPDVLKAINMQEITGRKLIAIVLEEQHKAFRQPVDFDGLKNVRRGLKARLVFIVSLGSANFARQRNFPVYSSLEQFRQALITEGIPSPNRRAKTKAGSFDFLGRKGKATPASDQEPFQAASSSQPRRPSGRPNPLVPPDLSQRETLDTYSPDKKDAEASRAVAPVVDSWIVDSDNEALALLSPLQANPPLPTRKPFKVDQLVEFYEAVRQGTIIDPVVILDLAQRFEELARDPVQRRTINFDPNLAASSLRKRAQKLQERGDG
jgi:hypothetical protein